ncbi:Outer membrane lipoprotein carrier protein [Desulfosarcina cetonica]|uniref:outer membrane lipoprotein carrier protein LolA n=1 Tax=Desulfosarcina cetonica TaxID=90730 RepID=UPI0006D1B7F5|nr:outer membrane lipoprotein carrier protein LolA [Desulfosarcina cetonica]VTR63794.1 Outer membrane lipoprotein carrier protein [Desulfosarcina cetonica]
MRSTGLRPRLIAIALVFCVGLCLGWADTWEGIRAAAGTVTSVETAFTQTKHLPILARPLVATGKLFYQTPGSLRWEYLTPIRSILLMDDGRVRRFTQDTQTHAFREETGAGLDAMQVVFQEISQWLAGRFDDNSMFDARLEAGRRIILTPKQKAFAEVLQRIELVLDDQPGVIRQVRIIEGEEAYTELDFSQTVLNRAIPIDVFRKVP